MNKDIPYSNREIDLKLTAILDVVKQSRDVTVDKLELIHEQTLKTNGRVTKSEEKIEEIARWRANLMGKIAVATIIGGAAWAIVARKFF